jgi:membrane protein
VSATSVTERLAAAGRVIARPLLRRLWHRYRAAQAARWATSISWNALFSFVPIVLLLVSLLGLLLSNSSFALAVELRIARLGDTVASRAEIRSTLAAFRAHTGLLAAIGAVALVWSGSALFSAMDDALSRLYNEKARPFLRKRLMGIGMIAIFTALIVPLLVSASLLSEGSRFSMLPGGVPVWVVSLVQFVTGAIDGALIYTAIYLIIPHRKQRLRHVLPGALTSGTLLELVTLLFPLFFKATGSVSSYGVIFSVVVLLITYCYLVGQITMLGAILNIELDPELRSS